MDSWRISENSVEANFALPHHSGPESPSCKGPKYGWKREGSRYDCKHRLPTLKPASGDDPRNQKEALLYFTYDVPLARGAGGP